MFFVDRRTVFLEGINAMPFAHFDIGVGLSKNKHFPVVDFLGSGKPQNGIGVGERQRFVFELFGDNLSILTTSDFLNEFSSGAAADVESPFFITRFCGFDDGKSNETPGLVRPEQHTAILFVLANLFVRGFALRRKHS